MANKDMKRWSISLVIQEVQVKPTEIPLCGHQNDSNEKIEITDVGENVEGSGLLYTSSGNEKLQPSWKRARQLLKWLNKELQYDPAILFLSIHPRELKTRPHKNLYLNAHSRCPPPDTWIHKMLYVHAMEYYSVVCHNMDQL